MPKDAHLHDSDNIIAFQDYYPDDYAHCYGCGRLNSQGYQLKSYWDGDEAVCRFLPERYHSGGKKDILYGGLVASLMDCHGAGTAAAAKVKDQGLEMKKGELPRFVTASLKVDYLAPAPVDAELELRANIKAIDGRKVTVLVDLLAKQTICAKGELLFIQLKE